MLITVNLPVFLICLAGLYLAGYITGIKEKRNKHEEAMDNNVKSR